MQYDNCVCAASYQLSLFSEDPEVYYSQFYDDNRHRILLRPTCPANLLRLEEASKVMRSLSWGLVPAWATSRKVAYSTFNARAETITEKPVYCEAFRHRRGVLVWDAYVEWRYEDGAKTPYEFSLVEPGPLFLAALWESWDRKDETFQSCTLITCEPNPLAAKFHSRMPVILPTDAIDAWLDPQADEKELLSMLTPFEAESMKVRKGNPEDFKRRKPEASGSLFEI